MHSSDFYATFVQGIVTLDPADEAAAGHGLPAVDSVNQLAYLLGRNSTLAPDPNPNPNPNPNPVTTFVVGYDGSMLWQLMFSGMRCCEKMLHI